MICPENIWYIRIHFFIFRKKCDVSGKKFWVCTKKNFETSLPPVANISILIKSQNPGGEIMLPSIG